MFLSPKPEPLLCVSPMTVQNNLSILSRHAVQQTNGVNHMIGHDGNKKENLKE